MLDRFAPVLGLILDPSRTQVFESDEPVLGFNSFPFQVHVFERFAPDLGFISFPSNIHVFDNEAPLFGFNSFPSQTQLLGRSILLDITSPFGLEALNVTSLTFSLRGAETASEACWRSVPLEAVVRHGIANFRGHAFNTW